MTLVICYVNITSPKNVEIKEQFIKFIIFHESTGKNLSDTTLKEFESFELNIHDSRGQVYNNNNNNK